MAGRLRGVLADTRPLAVPEFRRLWVANIVTVIGAQLTVVAVPAQLFAITGSSAYVGLAGLFGLVPLVVFGLYGGSLADHLDRRTLLVLTTAGLIVTSALFFAQAVLNWNNVWALLGIFAVQQACFALNQPARQAILPQLLGTDLLPSALALGTTVFSFGAIAGPLIGGALIPVLGFSALYLIDTVLLFATLWAVIKLPPLPVDKPQGSPGLRSIVEGLAYLRGRPVLWMSFVVDLIAMIFGMARALFPQIAHESFNGPREGGPVFALLYAAMPVGVLIGGVFSGWVSRVQHQGRAVIVSIVAWGVAMVVFGVAVGFAQYWWLAMLLVALGARAAGGAADMASMAFRNAILLSAADDAVRGRLQGIFVVVVAGGPRLADVLHGAAAPALGTAWTAALGGGLVVVLVLLAASAVPAFGRYVPSDAESATRTRR